MASMSFIVPDDVKKAFDKAYHGQNKSAVMTELIKEAIEKEVRKLTPPPQFAGQVTELGNVINTLSAKDWSLKE
ncbi:hypothetical protein [Crenothrix sp.]|uniref:hypothetical protein n=1 Tax=Crenothrix sp. TaxID=3100433 RepID=UPI00374CD7C1